MFGILEVNQPFLHIIYNLLLYFSYDIFFSCQKTLIDAYQKCPGFTKEVVFVLFLELFLIWSGQLEILNRLVVAPLRYLYDYIGWFGACSHCWAAWSHKPLALQTTFSSSKIYHFPFGGRWYNLAPSHGHCFQTFHGHLILIAVWARTLVSVGHILVQFKLTFQCSWWHALPSAVGWKRFFLSKT